MFEQVKDILVNDFSVNEADVTPDAELVADLNINSLELADLVLICEERFGAEISDDDVHSLITVGDIADYLSKIAK
ncbi:MAG: acyl carrier protein [Clostridia bacterium]|nr:acyl carrier protein [Clostridia bacterium]